MIFCIYVLMSRISRLGISLTMVAVLMVSMVGPGVAAAAPAATATATTDNVVTNTNHATTTNSETVTSQFQQEQADSCSPLETRLASIFTTYGYTVPDNLADCIDHDSSAVDSDEPSETGPDAPDSDDDTDETDETDETDKTEEPSDTTDDSSDSDETETDETDDSADTDSNSDADETDEESTDDTTDSSTDEETDTDTTTDSQDGDQTDSSADEETDGFDRAAVERGIHEAVNDERTARGLNELAFDTELRDIAREHSRDMAERDYFSHTSPDGDTFADRYSDAGYTCRVDGSGNTYYTGGENIAQTWYDTAVRTDGGTDTYTTETELANAIVTQWMNSPGHRENILASQWENEGIGIYMTDDGKVYATQNFC